MTVLVTGATGNVGSEVVRELRGRGVPVRAFVRDRERAALMLGDDVELAVGDFADATSIRQALRDVDAVFLASADGPEKVAHETAVIDACAAAGVKRIVKASTIGAEAGSALAPFDWNGRIEEHLRRSGVQAVILQSCFYMTNLLAGAEPIRREGTLPAPAGQGRVAMIDPRDTGAVAAVTLATDGHDGQTYVLTGPEAITYRQIADELARATGKPVEFVDIPGEAARQGLAASGMPDWLVEHIVAVFALIREDALAEVSDTVRALTGREPRSFATWARDHAALFAGELATTSG